MIREDSKLHLKESSEKESAQIKKKNVVNVVNRNSCLILYHLRKHRLGLFDDL